MWKNWGIPIYIKNENQQKKFAQVAIAQQLERQGLHEVPLGVQRLKSKHFPFFLICETKKNIKLPKMTFY